MPNSLAIRSFEALEQEPLLPRITGGVALPRPLRVGIISNPESGQNKRHGLHKRIRDVLQSHPQVEHFDTGTVEGMKAAARDLVLSGTEILVVNGGDGTTQAVLTAMFGTPVDRLPVLAVLAGGTTNCTAHNVGFGKRPLEAVQRLLTAAAHGSLPGTVETRAVVRADIANDTQYGMMFAAGAVYHGILFYREHIESRGLRGEMAVGLAIAAFAWKILSGNGGTLFPPFRADVLIDGKAIPRETYLAIMTSTISRQVLGFSPYWGSGPGPLRHTSLRYQPKHLARSIVPILRGKAGAYLRPEFGYRSVNTNEVSLSFDSGFTLDGELFPPADGQMQVTLSTRQRAYFLRDAR